MLLMLTVSDPRPLEALEACHAVAVPVHAHHVLVGGVGAERGHGGVAAEVGRRRGGRGGGEAVVHRRVRVARGGRHLIYGMQFIISDHILTGF